MSLYNLINGMNPATFWILPMLGKHPDEYPRFRDCFIGELKNSDEKDQFGIPKKESNDENVISVYTRVGGGNRSGYNAEIESLRVMPNYLKDYDDDFDSTFATFVFSVPDEWKNDFDAYKNGQMLSKEYMDKIRKTFPQLIEKLRNQF